MQLIGVVVHHNHLELGLDTHHSGKVVAAEVVAVVEVEDLGELVGVEVEASDVVALDVAALGIVVVEGLNLVHPVLLPLYHQTNYLVHGREMGLVAKDQHLVLVDLDHQFQLGVGELPLVPQVHGVDVRSPPHI
jgi:hypothetical protein